MRNDNGKPSEPQRFFEVFVDVVDSCGHRRKIPVLGTRRMKVAGNAANAGGAAIFSGDRLFECQAPATATARIEVEFQMIPDARSAAQNLAVLKCKGISKRRGKQVLRRAAYRLVLVGKATTLGEGIVHRHVAALGVLHEENDIRHPIEQAVNWQRSADGFKKRFPE